MHNPFLFSKGSSALILQGSCAHWQMDFTHLQIVGVLHAAQRHYDNRDKTLSEGI